MARREVVLVNQLAVARERTPGSANLDEVRVELRVIFPPGIKQWEADTLIENAATLAKNEVRLRLQDMQTVRPLSVGDSVIVSRADVPSFRGVVVSHFGTLLIQHGKVDFSLYTLQREGYSIERI